MKTIRQQIDERKANQRKLNKINFTDLKADMKRNPMIFVGLWGSAFFTALSGLFIGLAPRLDNAGTLTLFGGVEGWASAVIGIFFGVLYAVTFPVIGEWGTYYWHRKASLRDEGNTTQAFIGYGMMFLAGAFTVTTAIAASVILASLLHTFTAFNAIPEWAQKWTVLIIPIALACHAGGNIWFDHVSKYSEERREMERKLQSAEIESENRVRQARMDAAERASNAMADEYVRLSQNEARKAGIKNAERAWERDKQELGADRDNDGVPDHMDSTDNRTGKPFPQRQQAQYAQTTRTPEKDDGSRPSS
jgi:hypothetical protein